MRSFLKHLFPSRTRPVRRAPRRTSLTLESLGDRIVPAVGFKLQPLAGEMVGKTALVLTGDAADDEVFIRQEGLKPTGTVVVRSGSWTGPVIAEVGSGNLNYIQFKGGMGDDFLNAHSTVQTQIMAYGEAGNDTLIGAWGYDFLDGGDGNDTLFGNGGYDILKGGAGNDALYGGGGYDNLIGEGGDDVLQGSEGNDNYGGGPGLDVLYRNGFQAKFSDAFNTDPVVGLVNGPLTPAELSQSGDLMVSLINGQLTVNGPSGAGFQLAGGWTFTQTSATHGQFQAGGAVTIKSAAGDVPVGSNYVVSVATPKPGTPVGTLTGLWVGGLSFLSTDSAGGLAPFKQSLGVGMTVMTPGAGLGIKLGKDLAGLGLPLNPAVPYLTFTGSTVGEVGLLGGSGSVDLSIGAGPLSVTGAIDPSDPALFFTIQDIGLGGKFPLKDLAVGGSAKGQIPFAAANTLPGTPNQMYGHAFLDGTVKLGDYPVAVSGDVVLDLDANDDGKLALSGGDLLGLLTGSTDLSKMGAALSDLALGSNATTNLLAEGSGLKLKAQLTGGSLLVTPNYVGFSGVSQADLFAGTALAGKVEFAKATVSGFYKPGTGEWEFTATGGSAKIGTFQAVAVSVTASSAKGYLAVTATMDGPLGIAAVKASGTVWFNGDFELTGTGTMKLDGGLTSLDATAVTTFSKKLGVVTVSATLAAEKSVTVLGQSMSLDLDAKLTVKYSPSGGLDISGGGTLKYGVGELSGSPRFSFDDDGFSVSLPLGAGFEVEW